MGFQENLKTGKNTEQIVYTYLETRGYIVTDMSMDKLFQEMDVDCIIERNGITKLVEIKEDNRISDTGNFFLEIGMDRKTGYKDGWLEKTKCDYIIFYNPPTDTHYVLHYEKTKAYAKENSKIVKFWNRNDKCYGYGYVIPVKEAIKAGLLKHQSRCN